MLIEQNTIYAYKLQHIENPTFDNVQRLARTFIKDLPQPMVDEIYEDLNRGVDQLTTEPQMLVYLYSFGNMHQFKLNRAFEQLPDAFLQQPEIRIVDYGCGQAIGTMCYADFLADRGLSQTIKSVTLIEPSEICLKRAALHVSQFCPNAKIHTVCKPFDDLTDNDLANPDDIPTLHILSNVLDIQEFDLEDFATLISTNLNNYNQFVCVGPYFNYSDRDERMTRFAELLNGNITYSKIFEKGELCTEKTWTAQIVCFSVGISTIATEEDIKNGIEDEFGVIYSKDWKRLLKGNPKLQTYSIKKGTSVICSYAFDFCGALQQIIIPDSAAIIGESAFNFCGALQQIIIPKSVTRIDDGAFDSCQDLQRITIPNSVTSIGALAFWGCNSLQQITIPNSVTKISYRTFHHCSSLQQITIPNSVTSIEFEAFEYCVSLKEITIPASVTSIGINPFIGCRKLTIYSKSKNYKTEKGFLIDKRNNTIISYFGKDECVIIPDSITRIGAKAFDSCKNLRQITLPVFVTIETSTKRYFDGSEEEVAFRECDNLQQIIIPEGTTKKFKKMLPKELWDKLYCLKKAE